MGNLAIADSKPAQSEQLLKTDADLEYQMVYQRGIEAVLWSMPAISDVFFRESLFRDYGMKPGDVLVIPL